VNNIFVLSVLFVGVISLAVLAEVPPGMGAASYARRGIDARPLAMGGAFVAIAEGSAAAYYNPAGLAEISRIGVGGMYTEPYGAGFGATFQYLNASGVLTPQTTSRVSQVGIALTWLGFTVSGIPIWEEEGPAGTFTATSSIYLVSVGFAFPGLENWTFGLSAKLYRERILEGRSQGLGFDLAVRGSFFVVDLPITIGFNAMDVGQTVIQWHGTAGEPENYVPWVNKLGLSTLFWEGRIRLACDFDWAVGRPAREQVLHVGVEGRPIEQLFVRSGWSSNLEGDGAFSGGLGIRLFEERFSVDYAYLAAKALGASHLVSAQFMF
jgi:hypothetical protein